MADVVQAVTDAAAGRARTIVGIAGSPGSGKSTLATDVVARLGPRAALLPMDGFHLPQATLRHLGRRDRMGAPDTFDVGGFAATLAALRRPGETVRAPGFDREVEEPVPDAITIGPERDVIVAEGNYLLRGRDGWEAVAALLDLTLFLELDDGIRLARLIERHERFGKTPEAARAWALGPDQANARLIADTARHATHRIRLD
ncbi:nucleoside/nucleotide kinase family protein [Cryobacterium tepidiphilum]|uniref:Nucleoside/nucleotide kinase family protein n=1 Tax=Cryobacterium tepidiphilum TaxID=2486026 RepID=A0A3M8LRR7_9MICO|nr:nucleoside/nucleotide kinase family protein [Cryobacterium tepidiphilum]